MRWLCRFLRPVEIFPVTQGDGSFVLTAPRVYCKIYPGCSSMSRRARNKSESGIYHVMLRGINQQVIFEEDEDFEKFLSVLNDCKEVSGFKLFAYCLLGNHVHLLLKVGKEELDQIFKRIGVRYVYWYNFKYGRTGHLFQDRFRSEPVDDERYFIAVLKYILRNPVKAQLCEKAEEYRWSSSSEYIAGQGITDTAFVLNMFGESSDTAVKAFMKWLGEGDDNTKVKMPSENGRLPDREAQRLIRQISGIKDTAALQKMEAKKRDSLIRQLKESGLSIRQISRLTGVSFGIVRKH